MQITVKITVAHKKAILHALKYFANQADMANMLGITRQAVNHWVSGRKVIPASQAIKLERLIGGKITAEYLRPDLKKF